MYRKCLTTEVGFRGVLGGSGLLVVCSSLFGGNEVKSSVRAPWPVFEDVTSVSACF